MLLAFDLDKTLVRNDYELPEKIVNAVHKARAAGHLVTVLTGRPKAASLAYLELLKVSDYYSTNHGALITGKAGAVLQQKRIDEACVATLLEPYHDHPDIEFSCILDDVLYVKNPDDERWAWAHTQNRGVEKFDPAVARHADKIVFSSQTSTDDVHKYVSEAYPDFVMYPWEEGYLEVTGPERRQGDGAATHRSRTRRSSKRRYSLRRRPQRRDHVAVGGLRRRGRAARPPGRACRR